MPESPVRTTTRAYTLRLTGATPDDHAWREHLWKTHVAVNAGARAFGEWLLTMRGGLSHELADEAVNSRKGERPPTDAERRHRRVVLALSWLSVESPAEAVPGDLIVASGEEPTAQRADKVLTALSDVLHQRGLRPDDIEEWSADCAAALSAEIRKDAVWVNRSKAFDLVAPSLGGLSLRCEVWDLLGRFFGPRDAHLGDANKSKVSYLAVDGAAAEESDDQDAAKDLVQRAGQWLSSRFGAGKGADFDHMAKVYSAIARWAETTAASSDEGTVTDLADALRKVFAAAPHEEARASDGIDFIVSISSYPGHSPNPVHRLLRQSAALGEGDLTTLKEAASKRAQSCALKVGAKGRRRYSDAVLRDVEESCGFAYFQANGRDLHAEFAVMLDHAARRVSAAHTWIKRAEAARRAFEEDAQKMAQVPSPARNWLDAFCRERSAASNAVEGYWIRRRAAEGWKQVVAAWSKPSCQTEQDRIAAARALQDDPEIKKFGDIQLFEALADDGARCVWQVDGESTPQPLEDYVAAIDAEAKRRRFKVPAYRHPDPLRHPVFCDFGYSRWRISFAAQGAKQRPRSDKHGLSLHLWDGAGIRPADLRWQSKRLWRDLSLDGQDVDSTAIQAPRADRLGRAAAGAAKKRQVSTSAVLRQKDWNGRLQAPRRQLDRLASYVEKHGWDARARRMRSRLNWLITFSPRLQPRGPWHEYASAQGLRIRAWPHNEENKRRENLAKLVLCRLPGLRVLSIDLGHRAAAACAVWEAMTTSQVADACRAAGRPDPDDSDLYLHLKQDGDDGKERTTIYRRIGANTMEVADDETGETKTEPHPAPWARLDRQFMIKLQGEDEAARRGTPEEQRQVEGFEKWVGRQEKPERRPKRVDELMSYAVNLARLGLRRHADRARIAWGLTAKRKQLPGGREAEQDMTKEELIAHLQELLLRWHDLAFSTRWQDPEAKSLWDERIAHLLSDATLQPIEEGLSRPEQRKRREANLESLRGAAEKLAKRDRMKLHCLWATRWRKDDAEWHRRLRWLRDWVAPRGNRAKQSKTIRRVGGLSVTRIATFKSLYRVQKAFRTRPDPEDLRKNIPAKGDDVLREFGQGILDDLEAMRENRVKQLASRIAEAALGIGIERKREGGKMVKRPRERVFEPCHAVVIESLTHYRPDQLRTRRENRQLMEWSSSKVKKYLMEACELNGLHLREVSPGYTSRQDSRTGAPGVRCEDLPLREFKESPYWRNEVARAKKNCANGSGSARDKLLRDVDGKLAELERDGAKLFLRLPRDGAEIFVSADCRSPVAQGLNADLNAAANIGLRALLDPDWPGRWWYVPCDPTTLKPKEDKVKGSAAIDTAVALRVGDGASDDEGDSPKKRRGRKRERAAGSYVNLWRDVSTSPISPKHGPWEPYAAYRAKVEMQVVDHLRLRLGL